MNRGDLRTYVRDLLGEDSAAWWTDATLNRFINESYRHLRNVVDMNNQNYFGQISDISFVADQERYDLPSNNRVLMAQQLTSSGQYRRMSQVDIILHERFTQVSYPISVLNRVYYLFGKQIGVIPVPTEAQTDGLRVWNVPALTELTDDSHTPVDQWPPDHHEVIAMGAFMRSIIRDRERYELYRPFYEDLKESLLQATAQRSVQEAEQIVDIEEDDIVW